MRYTLWTVPALAVAGLMMAGCGSPTGQADDSGPDRILFDGKVLTVDEDFSIVEAIAIGGERILAAGSTDEILAMADESTEQLDLEGRTVIPGFIDNHFHYLRGTNFAAYEMRIQGITSRRQVPFTRSIRIGLQMTE